MKERKERTIQVSYGRTYNLGQYESMRIDAGDTITLLDSTDKEARAQQRDTFAQLKALVENELRKMETPTTED